MEIEEAFDYHMNRWETIAGEYYYTRDTHTGKFSYVHDGLNYIVKNILHIYQIKNQNN